MFKVIQEVWGERKPEYVSKHVWLVHRLWCYQKGCRLPGKDAISTSVTGRLTLMESPIILILEEISQLQHRSPFWYFCTSIRHGFLPSYTFPVLHTYSLFLFTSAMLRTACYLSLKYLHVLFAVFCLPSVFLRTFWSVTILSIHRNGEHIGDAELGASLLGKFWLTA